MCRQWHLLHILARCSLLWQGNQGKVSEKAGRHHDLNVLPRYAPQGRIAANRCFAASCCLIALDQPGSVEQCQDLLHRRCLHGGKITMHFCLYVERSIGEERQTSGITKSDPGSEVASDAHFEQAWGHCMREKRHRGQHESGQSSQHGEMDRVIQLHFSFPW